MAAITVEKSGISTEVRSPLWMKFSILFLILICSRQSSAADWKLVPTIGLNETYTDNVRLLGSGKEEHAYITQVSPGITVTATGQRLKLQANYVMQNSYYSGVTNETKTNHLLRANANAALLQNLFFLDGNASITQQNLTPFGQVADND
ncbi:MAG: TIGR03016 family PEP-CTERM system-associated outer membrane protein, partial [Undibacterium sp.]|nr:TIGR03016 family PEP-CTERM system-associated outer membrane protein [Undibacterium sp.]